ncbi:hypothetical protein CEXT_621951 [Caerostris extrusa]|uniref:Uncharacterized protein n=1 Tax=Caerostris extrusa TaxID=172846 RepID=A0AAV4N8P4_CAEEX|nr:hypothetical protein CEXT_621951 [Caerostris extrusa]
MAEELADGKVNLTIVYGRIFFGKSVRRFRDEGNLSTFSTPLQFIGNGEYLSCDDGEHLNSTIGNNGEEEHLDSTIGNKGDDEFFSSGDCEYLYSGDEYFNSGDGEVVAIVDGEVVAIVDGEVVAIVDGEVV